MVSSTILENGGDFVYHLVIVYEIIFISNLVHWGRENSTFLGPKRRNREEISKMQTAHTAQLKKTHMLEFLFQTMRITRRTD